ncbi:hypothetical protein P7K49_020237 [Saguinus oedipus]|uniref:Uncharacterized protein n=1 Tax=Saguinus oedipus TaxID=9490 RepID=A0ABQ9V0L1_SAGOE|nr:hypothetical protein P7K49_020237 [Saguinus oedipus]
MGATDQTCRFALRYVTSKQPPKLVQNRCPICAKMWRLQAGAPKPVTDLVNDYQGTEPAAWLLKADNCSSSLLYNVQRPQQST